MKPIYRIIFLALILTASFSAVKIWGSRIANPNVSALATVKDTLNDNSNEEIAQTPVVEQSLVSEVASTGDFSEGPVTVLKLSSDLICSQVELTSRAMLVEYLNRNIHVAEISPDRRWPIASITKLVTAIAAAENIDPDLPILITDQNLKTEGDVGDFKSNETYKASDLIKAMLMLSSNDAAMALADSFGRDAFLNLMQDKLKDIGMRETSIYEPTGLSVKNQSTPTDIVKLMRYLYNYHPEILKITRTYKDTIYETKRHTAKRLVNINKFAGETGFIGGKTGFIDDSGENIVSLFNVRGQPVVIVVLGSKNRVGETQQILECI